MKKNVGSTDRAIRVIVGIIILTVGVVKCSWLGLIGLLPITTGLIGWCPAYLPFGLSTCKVEKTKK